MKNTFYQLINQFVPIRERTIACEGKIFGDTSEKLRIPTLYDNVVDIRSKTNIREGDILR